MGTPQPYTDLLSIGRRRILVVDDDPSLRLLLRETLAAVEFELEEVSSAEEARDIVRFFRPAIVLLDVNLPGLDGISFCKELMRNGKDEPIVIMLTGSRTTEAEAQAAGARAILRKPFSPLELIALLDRVSEPSPDLLVGSSEGDAEQLLIYARDLGRVVETERAQRRLLQQAYRQTVAALADALEAKDPGTGLHAQRVQHYALTLAGVVEPSLLDDPSLEYGFLLHDVGKIGIPDQVLNKPGPLDEHERRLIELHPMIGAEILANVALLQGEGVAVVHSHHERWDGAGYPNGLAREEIPIGARIFAVADALDAMTSDRPYRAALSWEEATEEIITQDGSQFDPRVVRAFCIRETRLRRIHDELATLAA
ncbi:MAG TPA: HD domain-containing phosphohydrolase [Gaiellaceae bacterium]|nr:HD domain-containing phosphohydrolase [Gaiellaceae bacterium]